MPGNTVKGGAPGRQAESGKKRVLFIIPSLAGGGAERVFSLLVKHIDRGGFEPSLALLKKEGPFLADLPPDAELIDLKSEKSRYAFWKIVRLVRRKKPDIVCTTLGYLNLITLAAARFFPGGTKLVVRESTHVSESLKLEKYGGLFRRLYRRLYGKADRIICLSESMKQDLLSQFDLPEEKIHVIPNPVEYESVRKKAAEDPTEGPTEEPAGDLSRINRGRTLISIGRLEYEKGHDLLIEALARMDSDLNLILVGSGSRRQRLEALARRKGLADRVIFAGFQQNPFALTRYAGLFVFPSRYEGFGSAIVEALACGLPVVTFTGPTAAREIITPGFNGFLAEKIDPDQLAGAIGSALGHSFDADMIAQDARRRFDVGGIVKKYEDVFDKV